MPEYGEEAEAYGPVDSSEADGGEPALKPKLSKGERRRAARAARAAAQAAPSPPTYSK